VLHEIHINMAKPFFERLRTYYDKIAEILRGEADAASIFPNTSDIGFAKELIYAEFLKQHAPSKCNVFLGGFLFGENGDESKQLDVIISTDTAPRFDFHNAQGTGKSFGPVDGCLGVASLKSTLDKAQLFDALSGIASIPNTKPIEQRITLGLQINNYDDWPLKIIYATNGLEHMTILNHIKDYYDVQNPGIPTNRRPDVIHVAGKYVIFRITKGQHVIDMNDEKKKIEQVKEGTFYSFITNPDLQAMTRIIADLQERAYATNHIRYDYSEMFNKINGI
jgi:hypothetical protein